MAADSVGQLAESNMEKNDNRECVPVIGVSRHRLGTDGNGVTTLVAFHGCNLRCKYCLNPEALGSADGLPRFTPESLYEKVKVDDIYFRATGGGITFGGGEPCLQANFIVRFRELCGKDWKIRVETSLQAPFHNLEKLVPVVDEWIVDIKTDDRDIYEKYTGQKYIPMYQHLRWLMGEVGYNSDKIILRVPVIPGFTDTAMVEETKKNFELHGIKRFNLFTYRMERPKKFRSMIEGLEPGKAKCELLKSMRKELAARYGIQMRERVCTHEGDCPGTCPLCEAELESLTQQLKVIAPQHLEVSKEIIEKCQLNKSFSSDEIETPEIDIPDREQMGMESQYRPLEGDVELPPKVGEILPPGLPEPPKFEYKKIFFKECAVAGVSFHLKKDDELWYELCEGTKIALIRDRNNKYDKNAVAVALADDYDGDPDDFDFDFILGYLPRTENAEIAAMMDAGYADKFEAEITSYKRYGKYEDRIRITIWLLSNEPIEVRPDLLRAQSLDDKEFRLLIDDLNTTGLAYYRWGGFPPEEYNLPIKGERIVFVHRHSEYVYFYLMKVLAVGDDCGIYFDDPTEIECCDDCLPFILSNVMGPIGIRKEKVWAFMAPGDLNHLSVDDYLSQAVSDKFEELFEEYTHKCVWKGIDAIPSIEKSKDDESEKEIDTIGDLIEWVTKPLFRFYYRDTSSPITLSNYRVNHIITVDFEVKVCEKLYNPNAQTRFLIAASHPDKCKHETIANYGISTFDVGTSFMVLDVYEHKASGKRQILLVQIPEEYRKLDQAELVYALSTLKAPYPYIELIIKAARKDFDSKVKGTIFPHQENTQLIEIMKRPI